MSTAADTPAPAVPVGIVMGSDSDWPTMAAAAEARPEIGLASSAEVVSAHRMPEDMVEWAKTSRGGKQYDFLRMQDEGPICTSSYGLCE